jgi:hypothetical protein
MKHATNPKYGAPGAVMTTANCKLQTASNNILSKATTQKGKREERNKLNESGVMRINFGMLGYGGNVQ